MKLNILKNICLGGLILLSATSCEDFLTEKPEGTMNAQSYFRTKDGYEYLVKAGYEPVRYVTRRSVTYTLGTDIYTSPGRGLDYGNVKDKVEYSKTYLRGMNEYYKTSIDARNGDFLWMFIDGYNLIQRANTIISYGQQADISEELREQRAGEAKFLRALAYYYLTEQFGDIPLLIEEVTEPHLQQKELQKRYLCFSYPRFGRML